MMYVNARDALKKMLPSRPTFGSLLVSFRQSAGWTQEELGEKIGCTKTYISLVESEKKTVSAEKAAQFAEVFEMDPRRWIQQALEDQLARSDLNYTVTIKTRSVR